MSTTQPPFELYIPPYLTFPDYIAVIQTARAWADGYDLKSYPHLISSLADQLTVDYADVNPTWGRMVYGKEEFAKLWLSDEHLGNLALQTQHLLAMPYFTYVGPRRSEIEGRENQSKSGAVEEIEVYWQILASHGRHSTGNKGDSHSVVDESSDHRSHITHVYIKTSILEDGTMKAWKLAMIKPTPVYMTGDFARIRRPANEP